MKKGHFIALASGIGLAAIAWIIARVSTMIAENGNPVLLLIPLGLLLLLLSMICIE